MQKVASVIKEQQDPVEELAALDAQLLEAVEETKQQFIAAMNDDFNTALAIANLFELQSKVNSYLANFAPSPMSNCVLQQVYKLFKQLAGDILGVLKLDSTNVEGLTEPLMDLILRLRTELRKEKNYQLADMIRDSLEELNILVEDTPQGPRWKFK